MRGTTSVTPSIRRTPLRRLQRQGDRPAELVARDVEVGAETSRRLGLFLDTLGNGQAHEIGQQHGRQGGDARRAAQGVQSTATSPVPAISRRYPIGAFSPSSGG